MIKLNLAPTEEKEFYQTEISRRSVIFFSIIVFIITIVFIGLLAVNYFSLYLQIRPETQRFESAKSNEKFRKIEEIENQILTTNQKVSTILAIKNQSSPIIPIIQQIAESTFGEGSYIKSFSIDRESSVVNISGFSLSRDRVVAIENKLKNNSLFSDVTSPYSNFLKQKNIDFSFSLKLRQ